MLLPRPLASAIIVLVSVVWAANFGLQFFVPEYKPDVAINGIFMAVVGGALALSRKGRPDPDELDEQGPLARARDLLDPAERRKSQRPPAASGRHRPTSRPVPAPPPTEQEWDGDRW